MIEPIRVGRRAAMKDRHGLARALLAKDREGAIAAYRKANRMVGGVIKEYLAGDA